MGKLVWDGMFKRASLRGQVLGDICNRLFRRACLREVGVIRGCRSAGGLLQEQKLILFSIC